jgi:hypothetical protein
MPCGKAELYYWPESRSSEKSLITAGIMGMIFISFTKHLILVTLEVRLYPMLEKSDPQVY